MKHLFIALICILVISCNNAATSEKPADTQTPVSDSAPIVNSQPSAPVADTAKPDISLSEEDTLVQDKHAIYDTASGRKGLSVIPLPCDDASGGDDDFIEAKQKHFKYPAQYAVDNADDLRPTICAYGVVYRIWLGPKGWTGKGALYTDGGTTINLYPVGEDAMKGARLSYLFNCGAPAGVVTAAAKYFATARKVYNSDYNYDNKAPEKLPEDAKVQKINAGMITFTIPESQGFITYGIAQYSPESDDSPAYFREVVIKLPVDQRSTAEKLLAWYVKKIK